MATAGNIYAVTLSRDREGYREYKAKRRVRAAVNEGPYSILNASGATAVGSNWSFGSETDSWVWCTPEATITPERDGEPNEWWTLEETFTNKPMNRCNTSSIEDPLAEPDRLSGSFTKYCQEAVKDRFGNYITNSAKQQIRGPQVERDFNRPNVQVEKNLLVLPLSTFAPMIDTVNDSTLWGLPARTVKLSNVSWSRKLYGTCTFYYIVGYEFDICYETFDRVILDEGWKRLTPGGDVANPQDYEANRDINDEIVPVILNGSGEPWNGVGSPGTIEVEFYGESDLLSLGIPASL